jgi:hypothetical protein
MEFLKALSRLDAEELEEEIEPLPLTLPSFRTLKIPHPK